MQHNFCFIIEVLRANIDSFRKPLEEFGKNHINRFLMIHYVTLNLRFEVYMLDKINWELGTSNRKRNLYLYKDICKLLKHVKLHKTKPRV